MATAFKPSKHQQAYFTWIKTGTGNASLIAVAGAGKTTTLLHGTQHLPKGATAYAVVFNRKNADELRAKFPPSVTCGTFHSLWMRVARERLGNAVKIDSNKLSAILAGVMPQTTWTDRRTGDRRTGVAFEYRGHATAARKLVGLAKGAGVGPLLPDTQATYEELIDYYDIDLDEGVDPAEVIAFARAALKASTEQLDVIDFDDMLYLPLVYDWNIEKRDFVFVDEAQDTNAVQRALITRMAKPRTGRTVFVGDPHQAIYGFRGATNDAMQLIAAQWHTAALPLTVSFRCPKAVVQAAQQYVNHITAHASAPAGEVCDAPAHAVPHALLTAGTAVVCRTTAPLVQFAYHLIGKRIPCSILGRDIGVGLKALAQRMNAKSLLQLSNALDAYAERETAKALAKEDQGKAQSVADKVESLQTLISGMPPDAGLDDLYVAIDELFSDTAVGLTLCTVHKAKGLEWDTVCIARPDLMPLPWVQKPWQVQQEMNVAYVAVTRAKQKLVFLRGEKLAVT